MLIAGPNLAIDRTIGVERFAAGYVHRSARVEAWIGGGGANAAHTARRLGATPRLITMLPDADAALVTDALARRGVKAQWVRRPGHVRVATILREDEGRTTVLNEHGPAIEPRDWEAFTRLAHAQLRRGEVLLCSGSLPLGAPADGYAYLARQSRHGGARCVVDVSGEALAATLSAREGLLVPNLAEAEAVLEGRRPEAVDSDHTPERALEVANQLLRRGAPAAVVTAGAAGAAYAEMGPRGRRGWVAAPAVLAGNPIGAGDAFAAGLSVRLEDGAPLDQAVAFAVVVAAAHVESPRGEIEPARVAELGGVDSSETARTRDGQDPEWGMAHAG